MSVPDFEPVELTLSLHLILLKYTRQTVINIIENILNMEMRKSAGE